MFWFHHHMTHHSRQWVEYNACDLASDSVRTECLGPEYQLNRLTHVYLPRVCQLIRRVETVRPRSPPTHPSARLSSPQMVRWRTTFVLARSMSSSPRPDNTVR